MATRKFTRAKVSALATIEYNDLVVSGDIIELSLKGMLIKTDPKIPVNKQVRVTVRYLKKVFHLLATVIYYNDSGLGLTINEIDVPSFIQLRELIASKIDYPDDVIQETIIMAGIITK